MPAKKKIEVEVEVSETPVEETPTPTEAAVEVKENGKPILVAETEPEVKEEVPASQIFGPAVVEPLPTNKGLFWILIVVFAVLGAAAGGIGIYLQNRSPAPPSPPTPTPQAVATPTPAAEVNREDLAVQVLNGSGVPAAAAAARDFLEELGYTDVAAGNADSSDYATTQIAIKNSQKQYLTLLQDDLSEEYPLATEVETLDEDSNYDVVITLGRE